MEEDSLDWSFWQASSVERDGFSVRINPAAATKESNHLVSYRGILLEDSRVVCREVCKKLMR